MVDNPEAVEVRTAKMLFSHRNISKHTHTFDVPSKVLHKPPVAHLCGCVLGGITLQATKGTMDAAVAPTGVEVSCRFAAYHCVHFPLPSQTKDPQTNEFHAP